MASVAFVVVFFIVGFLFTARLPFPDVRSTMARFTSLTRSTNAASQHLNQPLSQEETLSNATQS